MENYLDDYLERSKKPKLREFVESKEFAEYQKKVRRFSKVKKQYLKLEECIYGSTEDINIYLDPRLIRYSSRYIGKIVISVVDKTIYFNEYIAPEFENGCVLKKEGMSSKKYSLEEIGLDNENILITLRKLYSGKIYEISRESKKILDDAQKEYKKKHPEGYKKGARVDIPIYSDKYRDLYVSDYLLEEFFSALLYVIDIVFLINEDRKVGKNIEDVDNMHIYLEQLQHILSLPIIKEKLPSNKSGIKNAINEHCSDYLGRDFELFFNEVYETIEANVEYSNTILKLYPEYSDLKEEYLSLEKDIEDFEKVHFNI